MPSGILAALTCVLCTIPHLGRLGFEISLVMAVAVAIPAGWLGLRARGWSQAARESISLLLLPLLLLMLNGLRVPTCDWGEALRFYLLLPVVTAVIASGWGHALGRLFPGQGKGLAALLLLGVASVSHSLFLLYDQAPIFSYDPIFGFWPGALYDEALAVPEALPLARLYHLLATVTVQTLSRLWCSPLDLRARVSRWGPAVCSLLLLCIVHYYGPALGFFQSKETLSKHLNLQLEGAGLRLHLDPSLERPYAHALLEDLSYQRVAIAKLLELPVEGWPTVDIFVYRSSAQRKTLMGADRTTVAKAWRAQVHMVRPVPGDTLVSHELTHLLAAGITDPLLGMPRQGILPVMGLVEGLAVAAAGRDRGADLHSAVAAMRRLELAPSLSQLMSFWGFYALPPRRAYPAAGSFVRFLFERYGAKSVREAYRSGDISQATGRSLATLETEWVQMLDGVPVSELLLAQAESSYRQEAIFRRVCPHEVALKKQRAARLANSRPEEAIRAMQAVVGWDPEDPSHLMDLAQLQLQVGDPAGARQAATRCLQHPRLTKTLEARARIALADLDWLKERREQASQAYEIARANSPGGSQGRALRIKLEAAARGEPGDVVRDYLLSRRASDVSLLRLQAASYDIPGWGVPAYLIGRRLYNGAEFEVAAKWFERASKSGLKDPLIRAENLRLLGRALYRAGQRSAAAEAFSSLAQVAPTTGYVEGAKAWLTRCRNEAVTGNRPSGQIVGGM